MLGEYTDHDLMCDSQRNGRRKKCSDICVYFWIRVHVTKTYNLNVKGNVSTLDSTTLRDRLIGVFFFFILKMHLTDYFNFTKNKKKKRSCIIHIKKKSTGE